MLLALTVKGITVLIVLVILVVSGVVGYWMGYRDGFINGESEEANKPADKRVADMMPVYRKGFETQFVKLNKINP